MTERRVVLYESAGWIVDAEMRPDGAIAICSGDSNAEWYAIIDRSSQPALLNALRRRVTWRNAPVAANGDDLLDLMAHAFSGRSPFEKIKRFLDQNGIAWRADFWGSM